MAIARLTSILEAGDGRLKGLWIDDKYDDLKLPLDRPNFEPWFSITCADGPEDISALIKDAEGINANRGSLIYNLKDLPFDFYLTDFRLCDSKEKCLQQAHLDIGLHAPSAGFLLGILTALRIPEHPQSIIPYSAYDDEFGQIWKLSSRFCPPNLSVLWDETVTKGTRNKDELIKLIPAQYRNALSQALNSGTVHMPFSERDRWEKSLRESNGKVIASEKMWFIGEFGARPILVGAMFYDKLEGEKKTAERAYVATAVIRDWLANLPVVDPIEMEARRLAEFYWRLRNSRYSKDVYSIIREVKSGLDPSKAGFPTKPSGFPWLCEWKKGGDEEGCRHLRLAILFVLIQEHSRGLVRNKGWQSKEDKKFIEIVRSLVAQDKSMDEVLDALSKLPTYGIDLVDQFEKLVVEIHQEKKSFNVIDPVSEVIERLTMPVSKAHVIQLLDPLPSNWDVALSLDKSQKVGRGLSRLVPPLDAERLLDGDGSELKPTEILACRKYARELMSSEQDWPRWLGGKA